MRSFLKILPQWIKYPLKCLKVIWISLLYYGKERFCPVCNKYSRRFRPFGLEPREDAQCVHCGALERHRLLWLYLLKKTDLFNGKSKIMLHLAPEECFESQFKELLGNDYLTADLLNPRAMIKLNITEIQYPNQSFDVIYCSHVLEHVQDDKKAMRELFRVLRDDGWAILLVPISGEKTVEDYSIIDPQERLRLFGHKDHVRYYGADYVDRLREVGFRVEVFTVNDLIQKDDAVRMGITPASGEIYYCTKK